MNCGLISQNDILYKNQNPVIYIYDLGTISAEKGNGLVNFQVSLYQRTHASFDA